MVRKIVRILSLVCVVLMVGIPVGAEEAVGSVCMISEWKEQWIGKTDAVFRRQVEGPYRTVQGKLTEGDTASVPFPGVSTAALETEPPRTGDYPAPIVMAMALSLGVVILMVLAENRKK